MSESASHEAELDSTRIRRITAEKLAANRFRSYLIIGGIIVIAIAAQIVGLMRR